MDLDGPTYGVGTVLVVLPLLALLVGAILRGGDPKPARRTPRVHVR